MKNFIYKHFLCRAVGVFCLLYQLPTMAASSTDTANLTVSADIVASCTISAGAVTFGNYDGTQNDAQADITATCTNGSPYTIELSEGAGAGASTAVRKMTSGSDTLNYSLYKEAGRTNVWGTGATDDVDGTGNGAAQNITVYGRIPANQTSPVGNYSDTVLITITF